MHQAAHKPLLVKKGMYQTSDLTRRLESSVGRIIYIESTSNGQVDADTGLKRPDPDCSYRLARLGDSTVGTWYDRVHGDMNVAQPVNRN